MTKYKRQMTEAELRDEMIERGEMDEDGNLIETEEEGGEEPEHQPESQDQIDWKKRHDDGRRYQIQLQQKNKELESRLQELENKLNESVQVPDNMAEFEEWVANYPKVADMVRILARQEASSLDQSISKKLEKIDELDHKEKMKSERAKLRSLQPDFYDHIAPSEEWRDWILNKAPDWAREAVLDEKNPNAELVSTVIDSFIVKTGFGGKKKKDDPKTTSHEAASSVQTKGRSAPKDRQTNTWSESRVAALSDRDFDKYEEEIAEAMANGTFVYDIRDAQ